LNVPTLYYAPDVVVYTNGLVIYQTANDLEPGGKRFKSVLIGAGEMRELLPPNQVAALFSGDSVLRDTAYVHPHAPFFVLDLWRDTLHTRVTVHGDPSMGSGAFAELVKRLSQFSSARAKPWVPDSIEVDLRHVGHECNPTDPVPWPAALPHPAQLADTTTIRFLIASRHLGRVKKLLKRHGNWDCTPVLLDGRWWGFSYDFPYPAQALWLKQ